MQLNMFQSVGKYYIYIYIYIYIICQNFKKIKRTDGILPFKVPACTENLRIKHVTEMRQ
jgi:hypothetical protein